MRRNGSQQRSIIRMAKTRLRYAGANALWPALRAALPLGLGGWVKAGQAGHGQTRYGRQREKNATIVPAVHDCPPDMGAGKIVNFDRDQPTNSFTRPATGASRRPEG